MGLGLLRQNPLRSRADKAQQTAAAIICQIAVEINQTRNPVMNAEQSYIRNVHSLSVYCIAYIHLYSASCSAHQSEALPVRETQREESSLERTKRGTCVCVCVCLSVCMYVCVSICVCLSVSVCECLSLSLSISLSPCLRLSLSLPVSYICISLSVSPWLCHCLCLYVTHTLTDRGLRDKRITFSTHRHTHTHVDGVLAKYSRREALIIKPRP